MRLVIPAAAVVVAALAALLLVETGRNDGEEATGRPHLAEADAPAGTRSARPATAARDIGSARPRRALAPGARPTLPSAEAAADPGESSVASDRADEPGKALDAVDTMFDAAFEAACDSIDMTPEERRLVLDNMAAFEHEREQLLQRALNEGMPGRELVAESRRLDAERAARDREILGEERAQQLERIVADRMRAAGPLLDDVEHELDPRARPR